MSFRVKVYDVRSGKFLLECRVCGETLHEAESRAIALTALAVRGDPREMTVRGLHQCAETQGRAQR